MTQFIIEHLEPRLWKWCLVEYRHISEIIGKKNLIFTRVASLKDRRKLTCLGAVHKRSVKELGLKNVCILDPSAKKTLTRRDSRFDYLLLGGILGDFPARKRTKWELTSLLGYPSRNLGRLQMSTNTAAYVAWKILRGTPLEKIMFRRGLKVRIRKGEEVELPFRFALEEGKVVMPKDYIKLIKSKS